MTLIGEENIDQYLIRRRSLFQTLFNQWRMIKILKVLLYILIMPTGDKMHQQRNRYEFKKMKICILLNNLMQPRCYTYSSRPNGSMRFTSKTARTVTPAAASGYYQGNSICVLTSFSPHPNNSWFYIQILKNESFQL